ncbi:MAG: drug/metabolite exporter YedA [Acidimicrobiia bacterium]
MTATTSAPAKLHLVPLALLAVYVIWGSTYLALRFMVEDIPPLLGNAVRTGVAGTLLYTFTRWKGASRPNPRQVRNGWIVGTFLFLGGVGQVTVAESMGVGSGIAATAIAMTPVWASLVGGVFGTWPRPREWLGLAIGMAGVIALSTEGDFDAAPFGLVLIIASPITWAIGSVWSNHMELPDGNIRTALFMLGGSVSLLIAGFLRGEVVPTEVGATSALALVYLTIPGSLLAFSAYAYLLRTVRPGLALSYAYVNPMVAVLLGVWLGGEILGAGAWIALPLIVTAVIMIIRSSR